MRIAFAEWPDGLLPYGPTWEAVAAAAEAMAPDILITSPLPFGPWLAATRRFDRVAAERSVALHAEGVVALASLDIPAVVTSRPVWSGERLVNEGIVVEGSTVRFLHGKHVLPQQDGWWETDWYVPGRDGFLPADILGVRVGLLFCTELMFPERARQYGEAGVELIVVPRSTPAGSPCRTAGQMAAILSGSYVASSSRVGQSGVGPEFGGCGFAFAPDGRLLASTSSGSPLTVIEIDTSVSRRQKSRFPCYLREPALV